MSPIREPPSEPSLRTRAGTPVTTTSGAPLARKESSSSNERAYRKNAGVAKCQPPSDVDTWLLEGTGDGRELQSQTAQQTRRMLLILNPFRAVFLFFSQRITILQKPSAENFCPNSRPKLPPKKVLLDKTVLGFPLHVKHVERSKALFERRDGTMRFSVQFAILRWEFGV